MNPANRRIWIEKGTALAVILNQFAIRFEGRFQFDHPMAQICLHKSLDILELGELRARK